jgi:hypothetical protein
LLTFFRINSIFQVLALLILFLLIRLPYLGNPQPLLNFELRWMLVGEKLNEGLHLYNEILTQIGPLSSLIYQLIDLWAGKSQFAYELVALILIFVQCLYFVFLTNRRNLFNEKNYVSGLFFILLMSLSFDIHKLSPALLANTFLLIALNVALKQIEKRDGIGDDVFELGLFLGIATLFHLHSFVYIFWAIFVLFLYTGVNIRQIFLVILAYILPIFIVYLYFYFKGHSQEFLEVWLFNFGNLFQVNLLGLRDILLVFSIPIALAILGVFKVLRGARYNSFQNRSHQLLILFGIFGLLSIFLSEYFVPSNLVSIIPFIAFFVAGFFIHWRKTFLPELLLLVFIAGLLFLNYVGSSTLLKNDTFVVLKKFRIVEQDLPKAYDQKKVFVTGENIDAYKNHKMATGYLSWKLAEEDFLQPNNYISLVNIYNNFKKDLPEVIIDNAKVMPAILNSIPEFKAKYKKQANGVYVLSTSRKTGF